MNVTITESRFGFMQVAALVEINSGIAFLLLSGIAVDTGYPLVSVGALLFAFLSVTRAMSSYKRGVWYRVYDRLNRSSEWVLDDLDEIHLTELRETGSTTVEV